MGEGWAGLENIALTLGLFGGVGMFLAFLIAIPSGGSRVADKLMGAAITALGTSALLGCVCVLLAIWS